MSASTATVYVNLVPVFAIALAYLILDEQFSLLQTASAALIIFGVGLGQIQSRRLGTEAG
jgi:drug/metabolite transporter (DMT)-like permease